MRMMKNRETYKGNQAGHGDSFADSLPRTKIVWSRSKEQAWEEIADRLDKIPSEGRVYRLVKIARIAAAASLLVLIATAGFMRLYTKTLTTTAGEHKELVLSDGSTITLNAESEIIYKPLWYRFSRVIEMEGEAFFEVMPGGGFTVCSEKGQTSVYGTSFNINTRDNNYNVTCVTGRVKVGSSLTGDNVLLKPNQQAIMVAGGGLEKIDGVSTNGAISWKNYYFTFTAEPLNRVVEEISRQLDIEITGAGDIDLPYTGYFRMDLPYDTMMELVFRPFGINFVAVGDNIFRVITNE